MIQVILVGTLTRAKGDNLYKVLAIYPPQNNFVGAALIEDCISKSL